MALIQCELTIPHPGHRGHTIHALIGEGFSECPGIVSEEGDPLAAMIHYRNDHVGTRCDGCDGMAVYLREKGVTTRPRKVAVLTCDNGEYDAYVGYFTDKTKLEAAVERLKAERLDRNTDEPVDCDVSSLVVEDVPAIDDTFLDYLAALLDDAGLDVERTHDREERLEVERQEAGEEWPVAPCPGQIELPEADR